MAEEEAPEEEEPKKSGKKGLIIGAVLALLLGGGGFYAVFSGMILGHDVPEMEKETAAMEDEAMPLPDVKFLEIEPLVINLGRNSQSTYLRFRAQLEVKTAFADEVGEMMPRVLDVLNSYLRAIDARELEDPAALIRIRAQMLRRVQVVTGEGRVNDLLIMEFVLN